MRKIFIEVVLGFLLGFSLAFLIDYTIHNDEEPPPTYTYHVKCGSAELDSDNVGSVLVDKGVTTVDFNDGVRMQTTVPCVVVRKED